MTPGEFTPSRPGLNGISPLPFGPVGYGMVGDRPHPHSGRELHCPMS